MTGGLDVLDVKAVVITAWSALRLFPNALRLPTPYLADAQRASMVYGAVRLAIRAPSIPCAETP
jgi:hypothetical protein